MQKMRAIRKRKAVVKINDTPESMMKGENNSMNEHDHLDEIVEQENYDVGGKISATIIVILFLLHTTITRMMLGMFK